MQPLQRLLALIREQLFLMSKKASFTSATALVPLSSTSTTTRIHPWRQEHHGSIRHFYQEQARPQRCTFQGSLFAPQTPCFPTPRPLCCRFQALRQQLSSCVGLYLGVAASGLVLFRIIRLGRWLPRPTLIPIASINPWSKAFPHLSVGLQDQKTH